MSDRVNSARALYLAFAAGDREVVVDGILADEFGFSSPVDVGLDRAGYLTHAHRDSSRSALAVPTPYTRCALRSLASVLTSYFQIG
jgi:hypothetical protein